MTRKVELMHILSEYFNNDDSSMLKREELLSETSMLAHNAPIQAHICSWEVHNSPERFTKTFIFKERNRLYDFVRDILIFEDEFGHHGSHKIDFDKVTIEVYTHHINKITNLDQEYIQTIDMIHGDVLEYAY